MEIGTPKMDSFTPPSPGPGGDPGADQAEHPSREGTVHTADIFAHHSVLGTFAHSR